MKKWLQDATRKSLRIIHRLVDMGENKSQSNPKKGVVAQHWINLQSQIKQDGDAMP